MDGAVSTMEPAISDEHSTTSDAAAGPDANSEAATPDDQPRASRRGGRKAKPRRSPPASTSQSMLEAQNDADVTGPSATNEDVAGDSLADESAARAHPDATETATGSAETSDTDQNEGNKTSPSPTGALTPSNGSAEIVPHRIVEAILMAADTQLPAAKIASIMSVGTAKDVRKHIETLNAQYSEIGAAFRIEEIAGGYQILTQPEYNNWLTKLLRVRQETKLTTAAMETLSVVAYKQPCTRADIEAVRGVAAGDMLNKLREMNLVKIVGRAEELGRPILYGTTRRFLEAFGLPSLEDLPQVEALKLAPAANGDATRAPDDADHAASESEASSAIPFPETISEELDPTGGDAGDSDRPGSAP